MIVLDIFMVKIGLDTNAFQDNWFAQGEAFTLLSDFLSKGEGHAYVSEITVREHVRHFEEKAPQLETKAKTALSLLSKLLLDGPVPEIPHPAAVGTFDSAFRHRLQELKIEVLAIPSVPHAILLERDLGKTKPFDANGKGYRDALIWISFLEMIDRDTKRAVFITANSKDFGGDTDGAFHADLQAEIEARSHDCHSSRYASPKHLADDLVRPRLRALADEEAKTQELLEKIKSNNFNPFMLTDVVIDGLETYEAREVNGIFLAGDVPLEEPLWATMVSDPDNVEAIALYFLSTGNFICEGTCDATATVQGFLDKFEAFNQEGNGNAFVSTPNWNEHYSEVEVSNVPVKITFSFEFEAHSKEVSKFEITTVESLW